MGKLSKKKQGSKPVVKKAIKEDTTQLLVLDILRAGGDLGSRHHYISVPAELVGKGEPNCRKFGTRTDELAELADWLEILGIRSIAVESTGVYWLGIYEALESRGIEVYVVNAHHFKNVGGRKTDVGDSKWIQTLHSYGLLKKSFIPEEIIRDLRSVNRHRQNIEQDRSRAILHIQKALEMMNVKIHQYLADIVGVTGMQIVKAIAGGETDAAKLADFHNSRMKQKKEDWRRALEGNYKESHVFCLKQALAKYEFCMTQMEECDKLIEYRLSLLADGECIDKENLPARKRKFAKHNQNDPTFDAESYLIDVYGVNVTTIEGIKEKTALTLLSEIGADLTKWPTEKHFTSWLGLSPRVRISGDRNLGHMKNSSANRAAQAFKLAAMSLAGSKSPLGAFYRKIRGQKGPKPANKAGARKIAVAYYMVITKKEAYQPVSKVEHTQKKKENKIKRLKKQAKELGFELKPAV